MTHASICLRDLCSTFMHQVWPNFWHIQHMSLNFFQLKPRHHVLFHLTRWKYTVVCDMLAVVHKERGTPRQFVCLDVSRFARDLSIQFRRRPVLFCGYSSTHCWAVQFCFNLFAITFNALIQEDFGAHTWNQSFWNPGLSCHVVEFAVSGSACKTYDYELQDICNASLQHWHGITNDLTLDCS